MSRYITLEPPYSSDYTSIAKVKAAWNAGLDFKVCEFGPDAGRAVSIRETPALLKQGRTHVAIRYARLTKVVNLPLKGN